MVIYEDALIYLDYDSKTDILWIKWPDLENEPMSEVRPAINRILETIKAYRVKNLLIDTKDTKTNIPEDEFKVMAKEFVLGLADSDIKKIARVIYAEPTREIRAKILMEQLTAWLAPEFENREFTDIKSAFDWLENGKEKNE